MVCLARLAAGRLGGLAWSERLSSTRYQLPLVLVLMNLLMLMLSPRQNPVYALPLLLPLAVLAAVELDTPQTWRRCVL